jgi:hypothetical protein
MIVEKNHQKDYELAVPAELLRMAHLSGRVRIIVDEHEIRITKAIDKDDLNWLHLKQAKHTAGIDMSAVCRVFLDIP